MAKHPQTIRRQFADELFECDWPFCGLAFKGLKSAGEDETTFANKISSNCFYEPRIDEFFCSDVVFNLSRILKRMEIKFSEKDLNFTK